VLYLPDREAEGLADVQRMMTGARQTFQSRMTFHYDFLLKTLQSGNLDWLKLLKQSYWYRRHEMMLDGIQREVDAEEAKLGKMDLKPNEISAMEERDELAARLRNTTNAARREAQKAWSAWENTHVGPRWNTVIKEIWSAWQATQRDLASLKRDLIQDPSQGVWQSLEALAVMGLLEQPAQALKLTPLGTMATEVNEGHPILMAQAYQRGLLKDLTAEEILAVLMGFSEESKRDAPAVDSLDVPRPVIAALWSIYRIGEENQRLETVRPPRDSYWDINTTWVEPIWRWLGGATVQELCTDYECYEGNLMRLLSKLGNLLEEWRSLATLAKDTEMLEKMRGLETKIMRDLGAGDSLYLRL
jgi:superfamily II RNA helicase